LLYDPLPQVAQNLYLQVFEGAQLRALQRGVETLNGSFNKKNVSGTDYWYFQYTGANSKLVQFFVGPDSQALRKLISEKKAAPDSNSLRSMNESAIKLGCRPISNEHFKVLSPLEQHGLFAAGAVLVGTHAFIAYGNILGVRWKDQLGTEDPDFAHAGRSVSVALPTNFSLNTRDVVHSLEMGFLPASTFGKVFGGSFVHPKQPEFRLDFLTTKTSQGDDPVFNEQLGTSLQPLPFIQFSLEEVQQVVLLSNLGAVFVTVPHPARYAVHKLMVFGERAGAYLAKAKKDLDQAAALVEWYLNNNPDTLLARESLLIAQGKGWQKRYETGLKALANSYSKIHERLVAARASHLPDDDDADDGWAPV
jgi:hypothetical protein